MGNAVKLICNMQRCFVVAIMATRKLENKYSTSPQEHLAYPNKDHPGHLTAAEILQSTTLFSSVITLKITIILKSK